MKHNHEEHENKESIKAQAQNSFTWWIDQSKISSTDSGGVIVKKVLVRIGGIMFLIALSPVIIIALIVSFLIML